MHGNVSEWVADWFEMGYFKESPIENPPGPASSTIMPGGGARTIKGGSCVDPLNRLRSAYRSYRPPDYRAADLGFRVVCEVK
jgi:formylglycine-generating enzyme required for sulfatase activity